MKTDSKTETPQRVGPVAPLLAVRREVLGRMVREIWIEWAKEQPIVKPSWLVPFDDLSEPDKEVDRRIGERLFGFGYDCGKSGATAPIRRPSSANIGDDTDARRS